MSQNRTLAQEIYLVHKTVSPRKRVGSGDKTSINLNFPSLSWDVLLLCLFTLIVFDGVVCVYFKCLKVSAITICTSEL